jgi:GAF domain-containing protein
VLREIARAAARLMNAPVVGVWEADEAERALEIRAFSDDRLRAGYPRTRIGFDEGLPGWVATHRRPVDIADVFADGRVLALEWFQAHGLRSAYVVPVVHQDALLGVLALNGPAAFRFGPEDEELLRSFVDQAALAIRNARLYRSSEAGRTRLAALVGVIQGMTRGLDLPAVLQGVAEAAATVFEGEAGIRLLEGDELVWLASTPGVKGAMRGFERLPISEASVSGRVILGKQPVVISDILAEPWLPPAHRRAVRPDRSGAVMGLPIRAGDRMLGVLLVFRERGHRFGAETVRVGMSLADQAGIAIENARLYAETVARRREAQALAHVTGLITRSLDLEATLAAIVEQVCRLLGTERAAFAMVSPDGGPGGYRFVAGRGMSAQFSGRTHPSHPRDGTTAVAIVERRTVWSADLLNDPAFDLAPQTRAAVVAEGYRGALVEDEDGLRELLARVLAQRGYAVLAARDGVEALALLEAREREPDVAITDVIMPRLSGADLVERLRARRPGLRVLYISGYTADVLGARGELGPPDDAFLAKPFTPDVLLRKLREVLDGPRRAV